MAIESILIVALLAATGLVTGCKNPSDDILKMKLLEFSRMADRFQQRILATGRRVQLDRRSQTSSLALIDESLCQMDNRNRTTVGMRSLCPFEYTVTERENMFPRQRVTVKCGCPKCRTFDGDTIGEGVFGCTPVFRPEPALKRSDTCSDSDGFYKWEGVLENVAIACTCQEKKIH